LETAFKDAVRDKVYRTLREPEDVIAKEIQIFLDSGAVVASRIHEWLRLEANFPVPIQSRNLTGKLKLRGTP
jgi:hypothetical protein